MADNYILTPEGKQQLEEELHYLETEKRAEVGERIKVAREFGDISENSEYDDAKNEQGMMEARIAEITRILGEATVVATPCTSALPSRLTWAVASACSPSWALPRLTAMPARSPTSPRSARPCLRTRRATRSRPPARPVASSR